jgi:hypothetical protein
MLSQSWLLTIAYIVTAWLVMQVADVILNNVEASGKLDAG